MCVCLTKILFVIANEYFKNYVYAALNKKLTQLTKKKDMDTLDLWTKSIVNHLYWVAASTPDGNGDMMVAKWLSLLNHVANKHEGHDQLLSSLNHVVLGPDAPLFPACLHDPLGEEDRDKAWMIPGTLMEVYILKVTQRSSSQAYSDL